MLFLCVYLTSELFSEEDSYAVPVVFCVRLFSITFPVDGDAAVVNSVF